ncbi:dehydrodolichyl diphosphate synthase complex subunit nus1 isoform X4 [Syngnathoides biaculeatus]|uniref:dehydrodolichyl diphosphate synthase complex subunit nus1 isoform X4 n=1 Tax=Syngnathoides biaculeatus TaxID=300417 RepID=UPI002ADD8BA2|nr:dehydrodolichyl diphosphate synthase complex subunit nus1 isoform X4 [Syngnathoides biaculeatus]
MALLYSLLWRLLLFLLHGRALVSWLRVLLRSWKGRLWERAMATLLLPLALVGFPDHRRKLDHNSDFNGTVGNGNCAPHLRHRWLNDGQSFEKLPSHIGLLVIEEEPSFTDVANLVVWCMAVGISYVSIFDHHGIFRKNNSRLLEVIVMQQHHLLGTERSKYNVEFLTDSADTYHNNAPCHHTETSLMRTYGVPCSGMANVSNAWASDVQAGLKFITKDEVRGSHGQVKEGRVRPFMPL